MKKDIYFIRHGQTEKNATHVHQHYDEPLSKEGKKQASHIASVLQKLPIDTLITSPFTRARQTAEIISHRIGIPYIIDTSVHETIRPMYLYGKRHASLVTIKYIFNLFIHRADATWDDDGAENMFTIRNRVYDAKDMIMEDTGKTLAIVSHAIFIDLFVHLVCAQKPLTWWQFVRIVLFVKKMPNTSMVHMQYNPEAAKGTCMWQFMGLITPDDAETIA